MMGVFECRVAVIAQGRGYFAGCQTGSISGGLHVWALQQLLAQATGAIVVFVSIDTETNLLLFRRREFELS